MKDFKIGLALGGGAALGFAHIGVLKVLEEYNITPDYITGTSMGSIIGALYSHGLKVKDLLEMVEDFNIRKICDFKLFSVFKDGAFSTEKLMNFFQKYIGDARIEDAKIPFKCTSVDLKTGKEYVFKDGCIIEAIRASSAIPGIFKPIEKDDMILVDGGILNNVPYDIVKDMGADFVIGVDVLSGYPQNPKLDGVARLIVTSLNLLQENYEKYRFIQNKKICDYMLNVEVPLAGEDFSKENIEKAIKFGEISARQEIKRLMKKINHKKDEVVGQNQ